MKKILIPSKDKVFTVLVDDEDYPILSRHKWNILFSRQRPYAFTRLYNEEKKNGKTFLMTHMILGSAAMSDHWDTNSLNNQKKNLRPATRSQNGANAKKMATRNGKPCTSKHKGVTFAQGKYRAVIRCDGKTYQLGSYINEDEAGAAYNRKAIELFGEFALLNIIDKKQQLAKLPF